MSKSKTKYCPICKNRVKLDRFLSNISYRKFYFCKKCKLLFAYEEFKFRRVIVYKNKTQNQTIIKSGLTDSELRAFMKNKSESEILLVK